VKAVLFELRSNPAVSDALGDTIKPEKDDMFGQLWVDGQVSVSTEEKKREKKTHFNSSCV
jgi:hypothetical protein